MVVSIPGVHLTDKIPTDESMSQNIHHADECIYTANDKVKQANYDMKAKIKESVTTELLMPAFASHGLFIKGVRGVESRIYLPGINVGFKEELYIYPASYTAFSDTGIMRACR